ncbi:hypothetical protein [Peptoniphilus sp.]|uniref:hypothetical protein n=1 Tax=Peptoniphilus sp. TaxID=1971214 RepID=UPI002A824B18|nr:hypothetical protein [Peptoniphilus sp.]MDY3902434.1 hypothetical protein [Peptoniphilus sp.]
MKKKKEKKKVATYNLTWEQIEAIKKKAFEDGFKSAIDMASKWSMYAPMMVLRDFFGFGGQRLKRFYENLIEMYDSIDKDYLDLKDISETLKEEAGIDLEV